MKAAVARYGGKRTRRPSRALDESPGRVQIDVVVGQMHLPDASSGRWGAVPTPRPLASLFGPFGARHRHFPTGRRITEILKPRDCRGWVR